MTDGFVSHGGQHEFVVARAAAQHGLANARSRELLRKLQRHRPGHQREDRGRVLLDRWDVGSKVDRTERGPDFLYDPASAILERLLESAYDFVAEGEIGADRDYPLISLLARPFAERMAGLRARPA